ncbi:MAG: hypothetical protein AAGI48_09025 [Verrucomicrobiota bacterium]
MKRIIPIFAVVLAMMLSSCIEHHVTIVLNKDGSGTITEETTMSAENAMMAAQMGGDPFKDATDEAKLKAKAAEMGEGVTLEKAEKIAANGRSGGRVTYAFKDINTLKYGFGDSVSEMSEGMKPPGEAAEEKKADPIPFVYKDGVLKITNPSDEEEGEGSDDGEPMDPQAMMMAKQVLGDMKMSIKIEFPGGIKETNATYHEGDTVTFMDVAMAKLLEDPEKFEAFTKAKPESPTEMREVLKGIDGVKVETQKEISVTLK